MRPSSTSACVLLVALALGASQGHAQDASAADARRQYAELMALPMKLRLGEAMRGIARLDQGDLSSGQRGTIACMQQRFAVEPDSAAPALSMPATKLATAHAILAAYRRYWRKALGQGVDAAAAGTGTDQLLHDLQVLLKRPRQADWSEMDDALADALDAVGWHSLRGVTPPLRELIIWTDEETVDEDVELPAGPQQVKVVFMGGFKSRGWANYATCGRSSAGGWSGADRLFAVADDYDRGSEAYKVSYLAHEAQHFHDKRRFAGSAALPAWRLEYRAKLVELALAEHQQAHLLETFSANTSDDARLPHSYANGRVLSGLKALVPGDEAWSDVSATGPDQAEAIRQAARSLLERDDRSLPADAAT